MRTMKKKNAKAANTVNPKRKPAKALAKALGVSPSTVWGWRASGRLPKNRHIRAAFLMAEGRSA